MPRPAQWLYMLMLALSCTRLVGPAHAQITIGMVYSAPSGDTAGQAIRNTLEVLPEVIGAKDYRIVAADDGGVPATAQRAMRKLIVEDKVDVVIGPTNTFNCGAVADIAAELKTPHLCLAQVPIRNPFVFSIAHPISVMVEGIVEHMRATGVKTVAYIGLAEPWGDECFNQLMRQANAAGIKVLANERYARNATSIGPQALKVISTQANAVFVGAIDASAAVAAVALSERGYRGRVYHSHAALTRAFLEAGGRTLDGAFIPAGPFPVLAQLPNSPVKRTALEYLALYEGRFGPGTARVEGAYTWDAFALLNAAVPGANYKALPGNPNYRVALRDALSGVKDVIGAQAVYSLGPNDHTGIDRRSRVMVRVEKGAFRLAQ